jgi:predicted enzyme related to lactoylglutathione lyase
MGRVVHFEIHAADLDRAERFYCEAFGWTVQRWPGQPVDYRLLTTGAGRTGIDGALTERDDGGGAGGAGFVCTIEVDDLASTELRLLELGATRVTEAQEIPGVGRHAYFRDLDGHVFGVLQPVDQE